MATTTTNSHHVGDESSENLQPWLERWTVKKIGFHLKDVNPVLPKYVKRVLSGTTDGSCAADHEGGVPHTQQRRPRVFVPLCGKAVDMAYLVSDIKAEVVGVEGIRIALEEFAAEHPTLNIQVPETTMSTAGSGTTTTGDVEFQRFVGDHITLLKGDYFALDASKAGGTFDVIYDRASLVAIEPKLREAYVDIQGALLQPGGRILLVVLERKGTEEGMKKGPPFSVSESTVRQLFESKNWCESLTMLEQTDQLERNPEDRERYPDLDQLLETVYIIQRKK